MQVMMGRLDELRDDERNCFPANIFPCHICPFFFSNTHDFPHIHPKMKLNSLLPQAAQQLEEFGLQTGSQLRSSAQTTYLTYRFLTTALLPLGTAGGLGILGDLWAKGRMNSGPWQTYGESRSFRWERVGRWYLR